MVVGANEPVVPASELQEAMRRKTLEHEILKKAVDFSNANSGLSARQYYPGASSESRLQCS